eukprot:SAG11_NODE_3655_length_2306_cov_1.716357_4_plen_84_part_00
MALQGGRPQSSRLPGSAEEKVDLADLTWTDKEQVLRMLFAKINHAQQQRRVRFWPAFLHLHHLLLLHLLLPLSALCPSLRPAC